MNLLGISGKKQSGKDSVADFLSAHLLPYPTYKLSFAYALKREVAKACGITVAEIENHKSEYRAILQWWGTDFRRKFKGDNYWIEQLLFQMKQLPDECLCVITDVRFPNEADMIKELGGQLWRVCRISKNFSELDGHASEIALDDYEKFDEVIVNKELPSLKIQAINLYNKTYK